MQLERNQPAENGLREALAPWFDHSAAWLVLLCIGLTIFAALTGYTAGQHGNALATLFTAIAATLAAMSVAWRASTLRELRSERRRAWRWLAIALGCGTRCNARWFRRRVHSIIPGCRWPQACCSSPSSPSLRWRRWASCSRRGARPSGRSSGSKRRSSRSASAPCSGSRCRTTLPMDALPARGSWTVGLDAVIGVLAALLLLRRADWQGWPGLVAFSLALLALVGSRLLEAHAAAAGTPSAYAGPLHLFAIAAFAVAAHLDYLRSERRAPPMDAAERGSPFAPLTPYAALMLAGYALLMLHKGSFGEPAGLIAWVVCISAGLLFARQAIATALSVAVQTGLATRSAEARFNALIRNTADVIAIVTPDGTVSYVTPTAERIFGFQAQDIISQRLEELVAFDDRARLREFLAHDLAQAGASAAIEVRVPRGDDRQRVVEIHGTNMEDERAIGGRLLNLRDTTDRKGMEEQLKRMALHDPLTLLANRSLFRDRVEHAVAVSKRNGRSVAVMFVDLDNFKRINDSFGHAAGDRVLHKSAQRLVKATRNGDTVARLGGDEFAVLLENLTGREPVMEIAARIVESLQEPLDLPGADARIAASVGIAFSSADDGVEELMRNADVAMYAAKSAGKGRYMVFEAVHAARGERAARNGGRARQGAARGPVPAALPADRRAALGLPARRRGADPLAAPAARPGRGPRSSSRSPRKRGRSFHSAAGCSPRPAARSRSGRRGCRRAPGPRRRQRLGACSSRNPTSAPTSARRSRFPRSTPAAS